jgi:hypothetical protein
VTDPIAGTVGSVTEPVTSTVNSVTQPVIVPGNVIAPDAESGAPALLYPITDLVIEDTLLAPVLSPIAAPLLGDPAFQLDIAPLLEPVTQIVVAPVVTVVEPVVTVVEPVVAVVGPVVEPVVSVVEPVIAPVVSVVQPVVEPVVTIVQPVIETVAPVVSPVVDVVVPVVAPVVDVVDPVIAPIVALPGPVIGPIVDVVDPVIDPIVDIPGPVIGPIVDIPDPVIDPPVVVQPEPETPVVQQPEAPVVEHPQPEAPVVQQPQPEAPVVTQPQPEVPVVTAPPVTGVTPDVPRSAVGDPTGEHLLETLVQNDAVLPGPLVQISQTSNALVAGSSQGIISGPELVTRVGDVFAESYRNMIAGLRAQLAPQSTVAIGAGKPAPMTTTDQVSGPVMPLLGDGGSTGSNTGGSTGGGGPGAADLVSSWLLAPLGSSVHSLLNVHIPTSIILNIPVPPG